MRRQPTLRIPLGVLALLAALGAYALAIAAWLAPRLAAWPVAAQTVVYIVLGVVWIIPARRFVGWMETGRWRLP